MENITNGTMENGMMPKKTSGVATAGLTLGIIGTGLAVLSAIGSGTSLLGGGNNNRRGEIGALQNQIVKLEGEKYSDAIGMNLYQNIVDLGKSFETRFTNYQIGMLGYTKDLETRIALSEQANKLNREYDTMARDYQMTILNNKIEDLNKATNITIDYNKQLSEISDASILSFVQGNYISGKLYLPASSITPPVQIA